MADTVEVVIKIPKVYYDHCKNMVDAVEVELAIANGTVLPKGYKPYFLKEVKVSIRGKLTHRLYDCQRHLLFGDCLSDEGAKLLGVEILTDENELPNVLHEVDSEVE